MRNIDVASRASPFPVFIIIISSLVMATVSGCHRASDHGAEEFLSQPQIKAPPEYSECAVMVNKYVATQKLWKEENYNISFDGLDRESGDQVFRVSHIDTYQTPIGIGGIGSSFFLHVDCANMKIKGEYKQQ
ncbi:MAG: hypothetical protein IPJ33_07470 [Gammaproteobacteria bacterium]|nr:hypothetical protein [Gammaproteobacteria bacterium]MBK7728322.1 hypothetical protein [Gammaproteobacteria bacterium]MBK9664648.1 hypothetical protein [Gammaproteobacteria bacterium]MBP6508113.1 hypothetical protein [Opitutaceae bacterium]